jgi:serine/threonine-protein kinase
MGTALYVSPEQATGSRLSGASDVYSLGVVAYECLSGQPPFVAEQPLAIAIMHKHDPVPPLPPDVPRPVADLVFSMLAKTPDGRPETARHVADRADVIIQARRHSGYTGPVTSEIPVVPNYPDYQNYPIESGAGYPGGNYYGDDPERMPGARRLTPRGLILAGVGLAACGVAAIIAVLLAGGSPATTMTGPTTHPPHPTSKSASAATASVPATTTSASSQGTNLVPGTQTATATATAQPTPTQRQSPTPTQDPSATSTSPSPSATSTTPSPTGSATVTNTSSSPTATASSSTTATGQGGQGAIAAGGAAAG